MRDNKLIAEWMGLSHCSEGWITIPYHGREEVAEEEIVDKLQYHTSWDWLMPVVEKCTQIGFIDTDSDWDNPMYELWERLFCDNIGQFLGNHIDEVYNSVVEFIKAQKI